MGKSLTRPAVRFSRPIPAEVASVGQASFVDLSKYRSLPQDQTAASPLHTRGSDKAEKVPRLRDYWLRHIGSYWTVPIAIPLWELRAIAATVHTAWRLKSIQSARANGAALPPIELGVGRDGRAWLLDGNHRLIEARLARREDIMARLTFVGT